MSENKRNAPELKAFEALLAGLEPAAPALDRDRLMYEAGRASVEAAAGRRGWPAVVLCVGFVAAAIGRWSAWPVAQTVEIDERPMQTPAAVVHARRAMHGDSWFVLRAKIDADLAADRANNKSSGPARLPAAPTWLEERRALLEHLN
jgi:hypothetical protein